MTWPGPYDCERYERYVQHEREVLDKHVARGLPDPPERLREIADRCEAECDNILDELDWGRFDEKTLLDMQRRYDRTLAAWHMILDRLAGKTAETLARDITGQTAPGQVSQAPRSQDTTGQEHQPPPV